MTRLEDDLGTIGPTGLSPEPTEVLIPEVRQRARRRRLRNLAIVLVTAALVLGVIAFIGSGTPATHGTSGSPSPSSPGSTSTNTHVVSPKQPASLAVGPKGELYVADIGRQQILRRLPNGRFVVVAGTGIVGDSGDGGRATQAEIDNPGSLAIAPNGTLYFVQSGRMNSAGGTPNSVVREVAPNGKITTVIGQHPDCGVVPSNSLSVPANSAEFDGAWLTIGRGGVLDVSTTMCPNILHLGSFLQLTSSGELVQTTVDSIPKTSGYCGNEVAGPGFVAFGCMSGAGNGPRLVVVRSNGSTANYPDIESQPNLMSASNGTVVAIHNGAAVRVGSNGLDTIATERQITGVVPHAIAIEGAAGIAIDAHGAIYVDQELTLLHRGCPTVILRITPSGEVRELWHSALNSSCY